MLPISHNDVTGPTARRLTHVHAFRRSLLLRQMNVSGWQNLSLRLFLERICISSINCLPGKGLSCYICKTKRHGQRDFLYITPSQCIHSFRSAPETRSLWLMTFLPICINLLSLSLSLLTGRKTPIYSLSLLTGHKTPIYLLSLDWA